MPARLVTSAAPAARAAGLPPVSVGLVYPGVMVLHTCKKCMHCVFHAVTAAAAAAARAHDH